MSYGKVANGILFCIGLQFSVAMTNKYRCFNNNYAFVSNIIQDTGRVFTKFAKRVFGSVLNVVEFAIAPFADAERAFVRPAY